MRQLVTLNSCQAAEPLKRHSLLTNHTLSRHTRFVLHKILFPPSFLREATPTIHGEACRRGISQVCALPQSCFPLERRQCNLPMQVAVQDLLGKCFEELQLVGKSAQLTTGYPGIDSRPVACFVSSVSSKEKLSDAPPFPSLYFAVPWDCRSESNSRGSYREL